MGRSIAGGPRPLPWPPCTIRAGCFGMVGGVPDHEPPVDSVVTVGPVPQMKWGFSFSDSGQGCQTKGGRADTGTG